MVNSSIYNNLFGKTSSMKGGAKLNNLVNLMDEKKGFLVLVFSNLIAQLGITYWVMEKTNNPDIKFLPLLIAQIGIALILTLVPMPTFLKTLVFGVFSYVSGIMLAVLKKKYDPETIKLALQGVLAVFGVMLASGIALLAGGIHLGFKFGMFLFFTLLIFVLTRLVFSLNGKLDTTHRTFSFIGTIIFAIYILYDTNVILQRNYAGDFITASFDYYLDIINLFTNILGSSDN